jgi:hypothetical protein
MVATVAPPDWQSGVTPLEKLGPAGRRDQPVADAPDVEHIGGVPVSVQLAA